MSETMSSVEIEDVLSSIRRLVSDDLRPGSRTVAAKKPDDKLLLTPAFRVVPTVAAAVPAVAEPVPPQPAPSPRLHLGVGTSSEKSFVALERAVEDQNVEWESEVGDPAPLIAAMEWSETGWTPVEPAPPPQTVFVQVPTRSWAQDDAEVPDFAQPDLHDSRIAEPDTYWADRAEAEALAELRADGSGEFAQGATEMAFDEEILRNLVRDMIREELQGALGERITRNVRKLVRAEIARALATQELT